MYLQAGRIYMELVGIIKIVSRGDSAQEVILLLVSRAGRDDARRRTSRGDGVGMALPR